METPDTFSRTFLPAAAVARIPLATVNRHVNVLRRCAGDRDTVTLVGACFRAEQPQWRGRRPNNLLMLTRHRLVVTTESPVLHRLRLYLNAELHHLADVTLTPEPDQHVARLALTAIDGVREHFCIRLADAAQVCVLDAAFQAAFRTAWRPSTSPATGAAKVDLRLAA